MCIRDSVGYLRDTIPDLPWLEAGHRVWFPEIAVSGELSAAAPDEIVLDDSDLRNPVVAINDLVNRWKLHGTIPDEFIEAITKRLAPAVTIRHTLADGVADVHARQLALAGLRRARRVIVYGGAGTGKTVLAAERARRLSADGSRVVLTCFNRPLGDALADVFAGNDLVTAGELLLEAFAIGEFRTDAVIIDEGQDFDDSWFMALEAALDNPSEGLFLVFADEHQAICREDWEPLFDAVEYTLDLNCRNTNQIDAVVARVYGDDVSAHGADGPEPEFHAVESPEGIDRALRGILHRLANEGAIPPDRVVILTQRRETKDRLIGQTSAGLTLGTIGTPDTIAVDTIYRFKGLEADAVIVILDRLEKDGDRALACIGLSRACESPRVS